MNVIFKLAILVLGLFSFSGVQASPQNFTEPGIVLELGNDSLIIDASKLETVAALPVDVERDEYSLQLKLTKDAAFLLKQMTAEHIGEQLRISFNGRLISSPTINSELGGEFVLSGLTSEEAEMFVKNEQKQ